MGTLELWNLETWKLGIFGTLELWNFGTLELWSFGTWEVWNLGAWELGSLEILELGNLGTCLTFLVPCQTISRFFLFSSCLFLFYSFSSLFIPTYLNFLQSIAIIFFIFFSDLRNPRFAWLFIRFLLWWESKLKF